MREITTSTSVPVFLGKRKKRKKKREKIMDKVELAVSLVNEFDLSSTKVIDALLESDPEKIADRLTEGVDKDDKPDLKKQIMERLGDE